MKKTFRFGLLSLCTLTLFCSPPAGAYLANDLDANNIWTGETTAKGVSLKASLGFMDVHTTELVFEDEIYPGYLLSELDWEAEVIMAGLCGTWRAGRWSVGGGYWLSLDTLDGSLVDYDWLIPELSPEWSDRSIGEAEVDVSVIDVNGGFAFVQKDNVTFEGIAGYRMDNLDWVDDGGTYIYSYEGFRDDIGEFDDGPGIRYEAEIQFPYIGLRGNIAAGSLNVGGYVIYSPLVDITAWDDHLNTYTSYEDTFEEGEYYGLGVDVSMEVARDLRAAVGLHYEHIPEQTGSGEILFYGDEYSAGFENESLTFSASLGWQI